MLVTLSNLNDYAEKISEYFGCKEQDVEQAASKIYNAACSQGVSIYVEDGNKILFNVYEDENFVNYLTPYDYNRLQEYYYEEILGELKRRA